MIIQEAHLRSGGVSDLLLMPVNMVHSVAKEFVWGHVDAAVFFAAIFTIRFSRQ